MCRIIHTIIQYFQLYISQTSIVCWIAQTKQYFYIIAPLDDHQPMPLGTTNLSVSIDQGYFTLLFTEMITSLYLIYQQHFTFQWIWMLFGLYRLIQFVTPKTNTVCDMGVAGGGGHVPPTFWMIFIRSILDNWLKTEIWIIFSYIYNYDKYESIV